MKKIGVVTYWYSKNNYGQVLQCYALQKYLKMNGYSVFLIKYKPKQIKKLSIKKILKKILSIISLNTNGSNRFSNELSRDFDTFFAKNISVSDLEYDNIYDLRNNPPQADIYICGSDQIWNEDLHNINTAGWFLDFGDAKKIAYAPSILKTPDKKGKSTLISYTSKLDYISTREEFGADLLKSYGVDNVCVVLDPTLLLKENDYLELIPQDNSCDNSLFCYFVNVKSKDEVYWNQIENFCKCNGLDLFPTLSSGFLSSIDLENEIGINNKITINEWLQHVKYSKYVITSSFHGTVFSILFHKKFKVVLLDKNNIHSNERIKTLLSNLGLIDRIFDGDNIKEIDDSIDWDSVEDKLQKLRLHSYTYLLGAIEGDYNGD